MPQYLPRIVHEVNPPSDQRFPIKTFIFCEQFQSTLSFLPIISGPRATWVYSLICLVWRHFLSFLLVWARLAWGPGVLATGAFWVLGASASSPSHSSAWSS